MPTRVWRLLKSQTSGVGAELAKLKWRRVNVVNFMPCGGMFGATQGGKLSATYFVDVAVGLFQLLWSRKKSTDSTRDFSIDSFLGAPLLMLTTRWE